jgi:small subunit ribosomal protein MRP21
MMHGDMQNATSSMGLWVQDDFASKHYQPEPELRLRPSRGRTVHVKGQVDVARAFRLLDKTVAQNAIKREARQQKSHERPALKRKRQKRERWQVRFKTGMRATIGRVMELKAQGW